MGKRTVPPQVVVVADRPAAHLDRRAVEHEPEVLGLGCRHVEAQDVAAVGEGVGVDLQAQRPQDPGGVELLGRELDPQLVPAAEGVTDDAEFVVCTVRLS